MKKHEAIIYLKSYDTLKIEAGIILTFYDFKELTKLLDFYKERNIFTQYELIY